MNKIALIAVATFTATGSAFAGSDHFGSGNASQPIASTDNTYTASVHNPEMTRHDAKVAAKSAADEPGQGNWGR